MAAPLLAAHGLYKAYPAPAGPVQVLEGLDLEVAAGERVAITGASGVGKSTLLHVLGTLDRADQGALEVAGQDVLALSEHERCAFRNRTLGFVFQFHHLLPEFTALENVAMPLVLARRPPARGPRGGGAAARGGGPARARVAPAGQLSGGEQQRVAIARALAGAPRLLLADEPTGNLDPATGERLFELVAELSRARGLTVVIVTHNASLARACDRVLRLESGRLTPARRHPRAERGFGGESRGDEASSTPARRRPRPSDLGYDRRSAGFPADPGNLERCSSTTPKGRGGSSSSPAMKPASWAARSSRPSTCCSG